MNNDVNNCKRYEIDIFDNHVIVLDKDRRILIDTGAPVSISGEDVFEIFDRTFATKDKYHGADIEQLSEFVGCHLDALIGNNVLANYVFQIDFKNKLFSVWDSFPENEIDQEEYVDADFRDIPSMYVIVNKDYPIISWLDTGAKISYINSKYVKDLTPIDQKKDFFPSFGEFDVPIYSLPITFNGIEVPFNFGVLPDPLEAAMLSANTKAIVGADIFQYFTLTFHYRTDKIFVENLITR